MPEPIILKLKVNGKQLDASDIDAIVEMTVDTDAFMPAMFSITFIDSYDDSSDKLQYGDQDDFKIGAEVEIAVTTTEFDNENIDVRETLIIGEITAIEPFLTSQSEALFRVRGYDRSHRLMRGKKTRTFGSGTGKSINEQDIIKHIAGDYSLQSKIDTSGISRLKYDFVMQANQTDWEFLWARARMVGYTVFVENKTLYFQKANTEREGKTPAELIWGRNLSSFEPHLSLMDQISESIVHGWDPEQKKSIMEKTSKSGVSLAPEIGLGDDGGVLLKKAFGAAEETTTTAPLAHVDQAKAMANASFSAHESNLVRGNGNCRVGDPRIKAGLKVKISNVGQRFTGKYFITKATHRWRAGEYSVNFSVSGSSPNTIYALMQSGTNSDDGKITGMVIGKVTDLDDPEKLSRVRVSFPWMPKYKGAELASSWARMATPAGGKERGFLFLPEIDDEVLIAFEQGDVNFPYILGGLWNKKDKPPEGTGPIIASDSKKIDQRVICSSSGHLIILNDKQGEESIIVQDKTGKNSIVIDSKKNAITMKCDADFTIEAGGKFIVNSKGDLNLDTKANTKITGMNISIDAKTKAELKIPSSQLALQATGAELKGPKVDVKADAVAAINGNAMVEIKGGLVKIN